MELKEKTFANEAGHWYLPDGTPYYTTIGSKGQERPVTLRDSRKVGAVPSVTGIIKLMASPGLQRWIQQQTILAALTLPKMDGESLDDYSDRVLKDSGEQAAKARDLGTEIHGSLERCYAGQSFDIGHQYHVRGAIDAIDNQFGKDIRWSSEKSFAHELGYGGKVDLHSIGKRIVCDFKTKDFGPDKLPEIYDEHAIQLAAYRVGLGIPDAKCAIVYVSTRNIGLTHVVELTEAELDRGWNMFRSLLDLWKYKNKYMLGTSHAHAT